jgi:hypothetical protein
VRCEDVHSVHAPVDSLSLPSAAPLPTPDLQKFIYIGIKERLKMMLEDPILGPYMRLPWPGSSEEPTADEAARLPVQPTLEGDCKNLYQSVGWWEGVQMEKGPDDDKEWEYNGCNIALSLNVDGVQPFKRGQRTMTLLMCMVLNLPENLRHRADYMLLAGIIAKKEPSNYNPHMGFLVRELLSLYGGDDSKGIRFKDPATGLERIAKVKLLFTACDYVAHTHVNRQHAATHTSGCHKCDVEVSRRPQRARSTRRPRSRRLCRCAAHDVSLCVMSFAFPCRVNTTAPACASSASTHSAAASALPC